MDIKRTLGALNKRMTPEIESMNVATQIREHCSRIAELCSYAESKIARTKEKREAAGVTIDREKKERQDAILKQQQAENDENVKDQEESRKERESKSNKSKKNAG